MSSWLAELVCSLSSSSPFCTGEIVLHVYVQEFERQVSKEMQQVTEYFGEGFDATDPAKVLRVIRDFMTLFDKSIFEIKVCSRLTADALKHDRGHRHA